MDSTKKSNQKPQSSTRGPKSNCTGVKLNYCRKLHGLRQAIDASGLTFKEVAANLKVTEVGLRNVFVKDDAKISLMRKVASAAGYRMNILITKDNNVITNRGLWNEPQECIFGRKTVLKNIAFLYTFVKSQITDIEVLAAMLGLTKGACAWWFRVDDITITHVMKIAKCFGATVLLSFDKVENISEDDQNARLTDNKPKMITAISNYRVDGIVNEK